MAVVGEHCIASIYHVSGQEEQRYVHSGFLYSVTLSASGDKLITGGEAGQVRVFDDFTALGYEVRMTERTTESYPETSKTSNVSDIFRHLLSSYPQYVRNRDFSGLYCLSV